MLHSTLMLEILFVLLWNSGFIGAEYALPFAGVFTHLFWRYLLLALILFLYLAARRRLAWPGWRAAAVTALVGVLAHAAWLSFCLLSIQQGVPAGIVALLVALLIVAAGVAIAQTRTTPRGPRPRPR
jgi:drug/metabolite transporter (DMT)-like permease